MREHLHAIGIMTGNSLDGADLVLTRFGRDDGSMVDLGAHSVPFPSDHQDEWRAVRRAVNAAGGDVARAVDALGPGPFDWVLGRYTDLLAGAVAELRARCPGHPVDLIGLHGQTCAHRPRSIAGTGELAETSTVQVADPGALAERTGVTVVNDFRSDDLMLGGEGAPLAPAHHLHLARAGGLASVAVANGGNTGNLSIVAPDRTTGELTVVGWDTGPFNHFPDRLMQLQGGQPCDGDGRVGRRGTIDLGLLGLLFDAAVVTQSGANFLRLLPPKSSDPEWYRLLPELLGEAPVAGRVVPFEDRVRTATYFASYALAHSLTLLPAGVEPPARFVVAGGGWRNPLCLEDCRALFAGDRAAPVLAEHAGDFGRLRAWTTRATVEPSAALGWDGTVMEARICADAAVCRIKGEPFTFPATTGARQPVVCGLIHFPGGDPQRATAPLRTWLDHFRTDFAPLTPADPRWSRASAGWQVRGSSAASTTSEGPRQCTPD